MNNYIDEVLNCVEKKSRSSSYEALILSDGKVNICDAGGDLVRSFDTREEADREYMIF